jgi:hypothetical protein
MRKILFTLITISMLFPVYSFAQITFEKWFGGDENDAGSSVQQTEDGGYIITGYTQSFGADNRNVYLIKTDSSGDTTWTRTYDRNAIEAGSSVQQTAEGGYIITGHTGDFLSGGDVYLIKTDSTGDTTWTRTYGGNDRDNGYSVQQTFPDSGYIITGIVGGRGPSGLDSTDVYLIKTDSSGDTTWTRTYGGNDVDEGHSVQQTEDGGYIITGSAGGTGPAGSDSTDVYLIKTNSSGDTTWTRTYGGNDPDVGNSVQQTFPDSGYIITGYTYSTGSWDCDVYLIKTDSNGDTTWTRTYGSEDYDFGNSVQQTTDEGYIVAGSYAMFESDVYLIKTDSSGDTIWTRTYGGESSDGGSSVQQTTDGGYIITGTTWSYGAGLRDVYLIKTDSLGNGPTGIDDEVNPSSKIPKSLILSQNYPNPFNPSTTISFDIPENAGAKKPVSLTIYDIRGRRVQTLIDSDLELGNHKIHWDGRNDRGELVASGIYLYRLKAGSEIYTRKMTILK